MSLHLKISGWLEIDVDPSGDLTREEIFGLLHQGAACLNVYSGNDSVIEDENGVLGDVIYLRDHIEHEVFDPDEDEADR
jgi:hypothetical protein